MRRYLAIVLCLCCTLGFTYNVSAQTDSSPSAKSFFKTSTNFFKGIFGKSQPRPLPQQTTSSAPLSSSTVSSSRTELKIPTIKATTTNASSAKKAVEQKKTIAKPATPSQETKPASLPTTQYFNDVATSSGNATLHLSVATGGNVYSPENKISCYSNETCDKEFPFRKKIQLQAVAMPGYTFKGWSEASCGEETECNITLTSDMTVKAYYEITKPTKIFGTILYPKEGSTCYIQMGDDQCQVDVIWKSNAGFDMTIKYDYDEYYVTEEDTNAFPKMSKADPKEIEKAEKADASGLLYFPFPMGDHKITILHQHNEMDSVNFKVACAPGLYWNGRMCWDKNGKILYIFKDQHVIVESDPEGIRCGYRPERCSFGFPDNTKVTLKATVDDGYVFDGWTGACTTKDLTCTVLMDNNQTVGIKLK